MPDLSAQVFCPGCGRHYPKRYQGWCICGRAIPSRPFETVAMPLAQSATTEFYNVLMVPVVIVSVAHVQTGKRNA